MLRRLIRWRVNWEAFWGWVGVLLIAVGGTALLVWASSQ